MCERSAQLICFRRLIRRLSAGHGEKSQARGGFLDVVSLWIGKAKSSDEGHQAM
jgi:hypothetical protein